MAQPTAYARDYDFEGFQSGHPSTPLPGDKVNDEFDLVQGVVDEILVRIALLQEDDLALKRGSVGYDQLAPEIDIGFQPPTTWETETAYIARDTVFANNNFYRCVESHTSGTFATDLAAGKWVLVADFTGATADAEAAQAAAEAAQAAAEAAQSAATTQAGNASTSAGEAASSASSASDSASAAGVSMDAALVARNAAEAAQAAAEAGQSGAETAQGLAENAQTGAEAALAAITAVAPAVFPADITALKEVDTGAFNAADIPTLGQYFFKTGDYTSLEDDYAVVKATDTAIDTAAWVRRFDRAPRPDDFGGSDYAATNRCITAALRDYGDMGFGPKTYTLDDDLAIDGPLQIRGVPGKTLLDFSSRTGWANGYNDGLVKFLGSQGTGVRLHTRTYERTGALPVAASGSRSGTEMTINTLTPHRLLAGDPVWHIAELNSTMPAGAENFFSVRSTQSNLALTVPFVVTEVVSTTSYKVDCLDEGGTSLSSGYLYVMFASDVLKMTDVSSFSAGQKVILGSNAKRAVPSTSESVSIGEHQIISRVLTDEKMLILHSAVRDAYAYGDEAKVFPLSMIEGASVSGLTIKGSGPNSNDSPNAYGDRGIFMDLVDNPKITDVVFEDVDQMGTLTRRCRNPDVRHCAIAFNASNEAGREDGQLDIQYGFGDDFSEGGIWSGNVCWGGRHAWDNAGTSTAGYFGVSRHLTVDSNFFAGQWWASIGTHQPSERLTITNNQLWDVHTGVDVRYGKDVTIQGNTIRAYQYGVLCRNYVGKVDISNNPKIDAGIAPIRVYWAFTADAAATFTGPLTIKGNSLSGGKSSIVIEDTYQDRNMHGGVDGNNISGCTEIPIDIRVAPTSTSDVNAGFHGSVSRNDIHDLATNSEVSSYAAAIRISNGRGVVVDANRLDLPSAKFSYGISLTDKSSGCQINDTRLVGGAPITGKTLVAGNTHGGNDAPMQTTIVDTNTVTVPRGVKYMTLDTDGSASNEINIINGLYPGETIRFRTVTAGRDIVFSEDAGGNIQTTGSADQTLNSGRDFIEFWNNGSEIVQTMFSNG